jgi:hypothetical protein
MDCFLTAEAILHHRKSSRLKVDMLAVDADDRLVPRNRRHSRPLFTAIRAAVLRFGIEGLDELGSEDEPSSISPGYSIAPTVEKHQNAGNITAGNGRPFSRHAGEIDRSEFHILCHRPERTDIVKTPASFCPPDGSRLGTQQRTNRLNFAPNHLLFLAG